MRKLALLLGLVVFASASRSQAALVDITLTAAPGMIWNLSISSFAGTPIHSVIFRVGSSLTGFTPDPFYDSHPVCAAIAGFDCFVQPGTPFNVFAIEFPAGHDVLGGSPEALLGHFSSTTSSAADIVAFSDPGLGGTVFDQFGDPIAEAVFHVVPEPGVTALLGLSLCALAIRRLTPSHCSVSSAASQRNLAS